MKLSLFPSFICTVISCNLIAMEIGDTVDQAALNQQLFADTAGDNVFLVDASIKNGAMINCIDSNGITPLHKVAQNKTNSNYAILQCILCHNPHINIPDKDGNTPLHLAAKNNNQMIVNELILNGANPSIKNNNGEPASQLVDVMNFEIQLEQLIKDYQDTMGCSCTTHKNKRREYTNGVVTAIIYYQLKNAPIQPIIEKSFSYIDEHFYRRIWEKKTFIPLVTKLLVGGARSDILLPKGTTALHLATALAPPELFALILKYSHDLNVHDRDNKTPIHFAIDPDQIDKAKLLLEKGADINAVNKDGDTPVHKIIKKLIALEKNINDWNKEKEAQIKVLDLFLEYNPELTIKNNDGKTAIDLLNGTQSTGFLASFYKLISKNPNVELIQKLKNLEENKNIR